MYPRYTGQSPAPTGPAGTLEMPPAPNRDCLPHRPGVGSLRLHRRALLLRAGAAVASAGVLGALLSACGGAAGGQAASGAPAAPPPTADPTMSAMAMTPPAADATPEATDQVTIDNFSFRPRTVVVPAGATVTWTNHDDVPHTVTSNMPGLFGSPALDTNEHYTHRFDTSGSYAYHCAIHPIMTGTVIVQ
ncbi:MAG TPA: cupredoxin family copper-binding protein [Thermomicrobiaceae bacterium]|nr:cupredoxin family copper-binding protein [Thermomicrobiaceae bacterium]